MKHKRHHLDDWRKPIVPSGLLAEVAGISLRDLNIVRNSDRADLRIAPTHSPSPRETLWSLADATRLAVLIAGWKQFGWSPEQRHAVWSELRGDIWDRRFQLNLAEAEDRANDRFLLVSFDERGVPDLLEFAFPCTDPLPGGALINLSLAEALLLLALWQRVGEIRREAGKQMRPAKVSNLVLSPVLLDPQLEARLKRQARGGRD